MLQVHDLDIERKGSGLIRLEDLSIQLIIFAKKKGQHCRN